MGQMSVKEKAERKAAGLGNYKQHKNNKTEVAMSKKLLNNPKHVMLRDTLFEVVGDTYTNKDLGARIKRGEGFVEMMDYCYKNKLSNENSILVRELNDDKPLDEQIWYLFKIKKLKEDK